MNLIQLCCGRRALVAGLLALACSVPVAGSIIGGRLRANRNDAAVRQLLQLELAWNAAYDNRNGPFFDRLLSEDFLFTDAQGNVSDKAGYIAFVVNPNRSSTGALSQLAIKIYGDTAVVVGRFDGTETIDSVETSSIFRFTDTWVKRGNRWYAIASQDTALPN